MIIESMFILHNHSETQKLDETARASDIKHHFKENEKAFFYVSHLKRETASQFRIIRLMGHSSQFNL